LLGLCGQIPIASIAEESSAKTAGLDHRFVAVLQPPLLAGIQVRLSLSEGRYP